MLVGLLLMAIWLGAAGDMFFKIISCGLATHSNSLATPMHSMASRMNAGMEEDEIKGKAQKEANEATQTDQDRSMLKVSRVLAAEKTLCSFLSKLSLAFLRNTVVQSWVVMCCVIMVGGAVLMSMEFDSAKADSVEWWKNYRGMKAEFAAYEGVGLAEDVDQALELLNSMGTCDPPPEAENDMDWTFKASCLYVFYVASTIGYG